MMDSSDYREPTKRGNIGPPGKRKQKIARRESILIEKNRRIRELEKENNILLKGNEYLLEKLNRIKSIIDGDIVTWD